MNLFDFSDNLSKYPATKFLNDLGVELMVDESIPTIQKEQWKFGQDSKGETIGFYSLSTEEITGGRKKAGTPWTLKDTGDFWSQTFLNAEISGDNLRFNFNSSSTNKDLLFETIQIYGEISDPENIFGIQTNAMDKFTQIAQKSALNLLSINLKLK